MNRATASKAENCISYNQRFDEAQSFLLSSPRSAPGAGQYTITATTQRPILLQSFGLQSNSAAGAIVQGMISDIKVAGQSLMVSDQSVAAGCFDYSNFGAENRVIGLTINNNQTVSVTGTPGAAASTGFAISAFPIEPSQVRNLKEQATRFNYIFGLPQTAIGAGASANVQATATRGCVLGEVRLVNQDVAAVPSADLVITSFKIGGIEMLCGATGQQVPFAALEGNASDVLGLALNYPIESNSIVSITVQNLAAAGATVAGGIFVSPYSRA